MKLYQKISLALLLLCFSALSYGVTVIELQQQAEPLLQKPMRYMAPFELQTKDFLALGDSLSAGLVRLSGDTAARYRVALQLETSMSISAEGPHLDLLDWKHCTTDWHPLEALSASQFQLPDFDSISTDCFPEVSLQEIKAEVLKQGGEDWVKVLEGEGWPEGYSPAEASLSSVRIKVEQQQGAEWQELTVIDILVPMGC